VRIIISSLVRDKSKKQIEFWKNKEGEIDNVELRGIVGMKS